MAKMDIEGLNELIHKVELLGDEGESIKKNALKKVGNIVKDSMEKKAPRSNTSKEHMAESISVSDVQQNDGIDFVDIGPKKGDNSKFFYSKFTEWGTSKIPAQHWAEKSVKGNKGKINSTIRDELERGLEQYDQ